MTKLEKANGKYHGTAHFLRKAKDLEELIDTRDTRNDRLITPQKFVIEKIIDLDLMEYEGFCMEFAETQPFIRKHRELMHIDENSVWHCILVRAEPSDPENMDGVLVESEGYDWARYSAAIGNAGDGTMYDNKRGGC